VEEVGHQAFLVQSQVTGVLPHEGPREETAGEHIDAVQFEGLQETHADLGGVGDLPKADPAKLPLSTKVLAERSHICWSPAAPSAPRASEKVIVKRVRILREPGEGGQTLCA